MRLLWYWGAAPVVLRCSTAPHLPVPDCTLMPPSPNALSSLPPTLPPDARYPNNPVLRLLTPSDTCRPLEIYPVHLGQDAISVNVSGERPQTACPAHHTAQHTAGGAAAACSWQCAVQLGGRHALQQRHSWCRSLAHLLAARCTAPHRPPDAVCLAQAAPRAAAPPPAAAPTPAWRTTMCTAWSPRCMWRAAPPLRVRPLPWGWGRGA